LATDTSDAAAAAWTLETIAEDGIVRAYIHPSTTRPNPTWVPTEEGWRTKPAHGSWRTSSPKWVEIAVSDCERVASTWKNEASVACPVWLTGVVWIGECGRGTTLLVRGRRRALGRIIICARGLFVAFLPETGDELLDDLALESQQKIAQSRSRDEAVYEWLLRDSTALSRGPPRAVFWVREEAGRSIIAQGQLPRRRLVLL
jgi:hypothetical protein